MDLVAAILNQQLDLGSGMFYGIVTQASPLLIRLGAATTATACRRLATYTPVLGDFVAVYVQGADRLALGKAIL